MKKHLALKMISMFLLIAVLTSAMVFLPSLLPSTAATSPLLKVHMLSYGEKGNDCFIIHLPNNANMIIDVQDYTTLKNKLDSLGITQVKYVVGTHLHGDHIEGMAEFINKFNINNTQIYYPKGQINMGNEHYANMKQAADNKGLSITKLVQGDYLVNTTVDGKILTVQVLSPADKYVNGGDNDYTEVNDASLVLRIGYGDQSILMMADARGLTEGDMLSSGYSFKSTLFKVGHHGRGDFEGATDAFLDYVQPTMALITNSMHEINLPVVNNLQERNIKYWSTGQYGVLGSHVTLTTDGTSNWTSANEPYWPSSLPQTNYYFLERNGANKRAGNNQENLTDDVTMTDTAWYKYHLRWEMVDAGEGYYYFVNMDSGMKLHAPAGGGDVSVAAGTDTSDNVKWLVTDIDGTWNYITHKASGMKLYTEPDALGVWNVWLAPAGTTGQEAQWKLDLVPFGS